MAQSLSLPRKALKQDAPPLNVQIDGGFAGIQSYTPIQAELLEIPCYKRPLPHQAVRTQKCCLNAVFLPLYFLIHLTFWKRKCY